MTVGTQLYRSLNVYTTIAFVQIRRIAQGIGSGIMVLLVVNKNEFTKQDSCIKI